MCWNFNTTFPAYRTIIVFSSRIVKRTTIYIYMVIVETFIHGTSSGAHPNAFGIFFQFGTALASQTKTYPNAICCRGNNAKACIALGVYLRIFLAGLVFGWKFKIFLYMLF